jgi:ABC-type transport system substrate-binding protein
MPRRDVVTVLLIILAVLCAQPIEAGVAEPRRGGTLRIGYFQDMAGLDPHTVTGIPAVYVMQSLFQSLVTLDEELNIVPELAEAWEVQEGGRTYVFRLRQGVQFHDGTPFDAAAVKWNFERLFNPDEAIPLRAYFAAVESVEAVDAHTLKITLQYPSHTLLLPALASYGLAGFMLISPTSYQTWGKKELTLHPAGTGPFQFVKWEQNQLILLERNPRYWRQGLPYLDRLEFKIIKEGVTRLTALRRGEVDFANRLPVEQVGLVAKDPKIQLLKGPDMALVYTYFNMQRKPFDDIRVRRALGGYGLNRAEIAKAVFLGQASPLVSMVPPGALGHLDFPELYPYNPAKAKALLKEAGYDEHNPLHYTILLNPFNAMFAAPLKTQLEKLGVVNVTVEVPDHPIFLKRLRTHELDQAVGQSYPFLEAAERFRLFEREAKGGLDLADAQDVQAEGMVAQFRRATELSEGRRQAERTLRYIADNGTYFGLSSIPFFDALRDDVKGFRFRRHLKVDFESVWLER